MPLPERAAGPALSRVALPVIAAVYAALFTYYLQATVIVPPFWDMYAHVIRYLDLREGGSWWAYLWEPHVQHRHVWVRLLTAFDVEAFSGAAYPFVASSACAVAVTAWLCWRESRRIDPGELGAIVACLAVMLVLTSVAAVVSAIPMDSVYPQTLMFSVLALVLFARPDGAPPAGRRPGRWRRPAALLAAMGAAFGNAAALALWPILAWLAWRDRAGRAWTAGVLAAGAAFIAVYVRGLPLAPEGAGTAALADPERVFRMADYLLAYMGLPWTRLSALAVPGRILGGLLLLTAIGAALRRGFLQAPRGRLDRLALAFILFSLASAALATLGRVDVAPERTVPVRYSLFLVPLHVGVLWLVQEYAGRAWDSERVRAGVRVAAVGMALLLVVQQVAAGEAAAETARAMRTAIERFAAGDDDPAVARVVFDDWEEAREASDRIRAAGLYTGAR